MRLSKQALPLLEFFFEPASCQGKRVGEISFPFKICFFLSHAALILRSRIHAIPLSFLGQLHCGLNRNLGANPISPMSLKGLLSLYEFPMETEKLSSRSRNRPDTTVGVTFGRHATCTEKHED